MKTEAPGAVNWRIRSSLRSKPSLELGASGLAAGYEGKEGWPLSLSHSGAGREEQE